MELAAECEAQVLAAPAAVPAAGQALLWVQAAKAMLGEPALRLGLLGSAGRVGSVLLLLLALEACKWVSMDLKLRSARCSSRCLTATAGARCELMATPRLHSVPGVAVSHPLSCFPWYASCKPCLRRLQIEPHMLSLVQSLVSLRKLANAHSPLCRLQVPRTRTDKGNMRHACDNWDRPGLHEIRHFKGRSVVVNPSPAQPAALPAHLLDSDK